MPRVQTFLSESVISEITKIIESRRSEGASVKEVNFSNITSMLVELGLRVYQYKQDNNEETFDQDGFNRVLLENSVAARLQTAKIIAAMKLLPELNENVLFDLVKLKGDIERDTLSVVEKLFPAGKD